MVKKSTQHKRDPPPEKEREELEIGEKEIAEAWRYISAEEKECLNEDCTVYNLEKCYLPFEDPALVEKQVEFCAKTEVNENRHTIDNRLIIKTPKKQSQIACIHTKVCELVPDPTAPFHYRDISTEQRRELREKLAPEEHYMAMRSFVEGLTIDGLQNRLLESLRYQMETGQESDIISSTLRKQLIDAMATLVPEESNELVLTMLELIVGDDPSRMYVFTDEYEKIICQYFTEDDIDRLNNLNGGIGEVSNDIKECIVDRMSKPVLHTLMGDKDSDIRYLVADVYPFRQSEIREFAKDTNPLVRSTIAMIRNINLPKSIVEALSRDKKVVVRRSMAFYPSLTHTDLERLARDEEWIVRKIIATRDDLSDELLLDLATDPQDTVRWAVAKRSNPLSDEVYRKLALDQNLLIRKEIASTFYKLPIIPIEILAGDSNAGVRDMIAKRADIPIEIQRILAQDTYKEIRSDLVKNVVVSEEILHKLARDESKAVRLAILTREEVDEDTMRILVKDLDVNVRERILSFSDLPEDILVALAQDPSISIRKDVADREELPDEALEILVADSDVSIREKVASYPDLPDDIIYKLAKDTEEGVLLNLIDRDELPDKVIESFVTNSSIQLRSGIADQEYLTEEQMARLADDPEPRVRVNLAHNWNLPEVVVQKLARDEFDLVRIALRETQDKKKEEERKKGLC